MTRSATEEGPGMGGLQQHLQLVQDRLKHENDLLSQRLGWLWALQGLLFTSFALTAREFETIGTFPITVICVVGIVSCLSIGYCTLISHRVLDQINPHVDGLEDKVASQVGAPQRERVPPDRLAFLHPWRSLPWVLLLAWVVLLMWVWIRF